MKIRVNQWQNLTGALSAGLLVVVFCLILLWHNPLVFWNDDYELSVLPVFADMARSWSEGHWPILSPYSWVCGNLAGEFQYGTFSLFVNAARRFGLEISTGLSTTGGCTFDRAPFCTRDWRIFARTRSRVFSRLIHLCRADCLVKRLDHLLGGDRLVRCARRFYLAAMGVVGRGTRSGFAANANGGSFGPRRLFISLVTGGFPYTVLMLLLLIAWLAIKSLAETRSHFVGCADALWRGTRLRVIRARVARDSRFGSGFSARITASDSALAMACSTCSIAGTHLAMWTVNWADFSNRYLPTHGNGTGLWLVAPAALIAGLAWRGRQLVRQIKWELVLLLLVLLLCMIPTAGLFRWSFRWLPFFHLVLAICAAEALHLRPGSSIAATAALALTALVRRSRC